MARIELVFIWYLIGNYLTGRRTIEPPRPPGPPRPAPPGPPRSAPPGPPRPVSHAPLRPAPIPGLLFVSREDIRHMQSRVVELKAMADLPEEVLVTVPKCPESFCRWLAVEASQFVSREVPRPLRRRWAAPQLRRWSWATSELRWPVGGDWPQPRCRESVKRASHSGLVIIRSEPYHGASKEQV